jgi:hypothetical protein
MRRSIVVLVAFAIAVVGAGRLLAAATGKKAPFYPLPSWDRQLPAAKRFVVLSDWGGAAVLDKETGLVWQTVPNSAFENWEAAKRRCRDSGEGGRRGWRLPTLEELESLTDPSIPVPGPGLPPGHPFTLFPGVLNYWTSTSVANPSDQNVACDNGGTYPCVWVVGFGGGATQVAGPVTTISTSYAAWCVRGGSGVNPE